MSQPCHLLGVALAQPVLGRFVDLVAHRPLDVPAGRGALSAQGARDRGVGGGWGSPPPPPARAGGGGARRPVGGFCWVGGCCRSPPPPPPPPGGSSYAPPHSLYGLF
jgi:hypothetical protein